MFKKGYCLLIKPKDKWLCVKYYSHDIDYLYYVPMPIDMLHKRHIKKMKFGSDNVRNIFQGKNDKKIKGVDDLEFN